MLTILTGEAKSGKRFRAYTEIIDEIKKGKASECMMIVPEQYTLEAEKELIEHGELSGFLGLEILSLKRLMHYVFKEVGIPTGAELSELGKLMLLKQIFETEKKQLRYYQKAFNKKGLLQKCHDVIEEFKHNRISPEQILALDPEDHILRAKLGDIGKVYAAYESQKTDLLLDQADYYEALIEKISQSQWLKNKKIWITGFDSFTTLEFAVIEELSRQVASVTVTLTTANEGPTRDIFKHTIRVFERLMAFEGVSKSVEIMPNQYLYDDLSHLSRYLMTYPVKGYTNEPEHVKLYGAKDKATEVEWVIRNMMQQIRSHQYTWRDFAIVTNDLSGYRMLIKRLFDQYEIPYFIDEKRNVLGHPAIHFLKATIAVITGNYQYEDVLMLLKTGYFDLSDVDVAYFDNYLVEHGIRGKQYLDVFSKNLKEAYDLERINCIRETFMVPLKKYSADQAKAKSVKDHLAALYNYMAACRLPEQVEAAVNEFTLEGDYENAQLFAQIWQVILNVFDQLVGIIGEEHMRLSDVWERLNVGLESYEVGILPLSEQHVLIGSLDRSKSHAIKVMFLMGINDGVLPEAGGDQQLILEHEKQLINSEGVNWLSDQTMFLQKENFNIYQALTRPSEALYLSYAYADNSGSALRPSYLVGKIKSVLPKLEAEVEQIHKKIGEEMIFSKLSMPYHLATQLRADIDGEPIDEIWYDAMAWLYKYEPERAKHMLKAATHQNNDVDLSKAHVKALYDFPIKSSVSGLEQYVQCPFKHFVSEGLKPKKPKPYEINYPDVGILFHKSLEQFGKAVYKQKLSWDDLERETCETIMDEIVSMLVDGDIYQSKFQYKALVRKLKRVSKRAVWTLTKQIQKGAFKPSAFELAFTDSGFGVPPIMYFLPSGERMMIRGVVDRIDILEVEGKKYINILDYKSGSRSFNLEDIYNGLQMQLFVYMSACLNQSDFFGDETLFPGGVYYYKIDDPMVESTAIEPEVIDSAVDEMLKLDGVTLDDAKVVEAMDLAFFETQSSSVIRVKLKKNGEYTKESRVLDENQFRGLMAHVNKLLENIGESIVAGKIPVAPCRTNNRLSCDFCDYSGICQFEPKREHNKIRQLEKLSTDEIFEKIESAEDQLIIDKKEQ